MELINGRTAEDIKKTLRICGIGMCDIRNCPRADYRDCSDRAMHDALALIERLEAQVPKWISVEERLPPPETKIYLIASHSPDGEQIVKTSVWAWDEIGETGDWMNWNEVTHWMPLPEPPRGGMCDGDAL